MADVSSTENLYKNINTNEFVGQYQSYRRKMDYSYFNNYTIERQIMQDGIISKYLLPINKKKKRPWILFTCGCFGAGKSHSIRYLDSMGKLKIDDYIYIDPDKIKYELPESKNLIKSEPVKAGTLLHKESTYLSLLLQYIILDCSYPLIIDGSLKDTIWYHSHINWIYNNYPQYIIGIIKVEAKLDLILSRCELRGKETGRMIPIQLINDIYSNIHQSFEKLKDIVNFYMIIENNETFNITEYKINNY